MRVAAATAETPRLSQKYEQGEGATHADNSVPTVRDAMQSGQSTCMRVTTTPRRGQ